MGVAAPGPDLVEEGESHAFLHPAEVVEDDPAVTDCGGGEVDVEDELTGRGEPRGGGCRGFVTGLTALLNQRPRARWLRKAR